MPSAFSNVGGIRQGPSITPRNIFWNFGLLPTIYAPSGIFIDGNLTRDTGHANATTLLRPGLLLGKITSTGKYRNSIIGTVSGAVSAGTVTSITVPAAVATEVARLITQAAGNVSLKIVGPPTAGGTVASTAITATAASGTSITISSATLPAYAVGSIITPADGSDTPKTVFSDGVYAIEDVTDVSNNNQDQQLQRYLIQATLYSPNLINFVADDYGNTIDVAVTAYLKSKLNSNGLSFRFSDDV